MYQQMSKLESKQAAAGTMSPKQKRVRTKSRSSGERCMSDQSDTDMDTSVREPTATPVLVDVAHLEMAKQASDAGEFMLTFSLVLSQVSSPCCWRTVQCLLVSTLLY